MLLRGWLRRVVLRGGAAFWSVGVVFLLGTMIVVITPDTPPKPALFQNQHPVVIIDAGHGGKDDGAKARGLVEKNLTLELAFRLEAALKEKGFPTLLTRTDDRFLPLRLRALIANSVPGPAIFVSLHFNTGRGRNTNGVETYYASRKRPRRGNEAPWKCAGIFSSNTDADSGEHLAADVQLAICAQTGARNRGIRGRSLHVTRETAIPAILIEGGFMSDAMEARLLTHPEYLNRLATGIAAGVESWSQQQPRREVVPPLAEAGRPVRESARPFAVLPEWLYPFVSLEGGPRPALAHCRPPLRMPAKTIIASEK